MRPVGALATMYCRAASSALGAGGGVSRERFELRFIGNTEVPRLDAVPARISRQLRAQLERARKHGSDVAEAAQRESAAGHERSAFRVILRRRSGGHGSV